MPGVLCGNQAAPENRGSRPAYDNSVHDEGIADDAILRHKLVFAGHGGGERARIFAMGDRFSAGQIDESNQEIVLRIEL